MIPLFGQLALLCLAVPLMVFLLCSADKLAVVGRWRRRFTTEHWFEWLTFGGSLVCLGLSVVLLLLSTEEPVAFSFWVFDLYIDSLSVFFIFLVNIIAAFAAWNSLSEPTGSRSLFFNNSVNVFHFTMLAVPLVDNLIWLWIAVEATTLVSTLLVSYRNEKNSWEAAWKYLIITSTGIVFALLGTMFVANAAKILLPELSGNPDSLMNWSFLRDHAEQLSPPFIKLSFLFILVGYGTKAGLAPMHTWLPDGHGEAPAPISALLSGVLLKSALYAILRFSTLTNLALGGKEFTSTLLLATGLLSLLLATPFILHEKNRFKRVLAYHSLEHMGIITFGLGIGGPIALFGALLHTLNHAVTKSLMFLAFGNVMRRFAERGLEQEHIGNVLRRMPLTGVVMALGGLALVGTPPFNIFLSELIILWGALTSSALAGEAGWVVAAAVLLFLLSTTLIFFGLIRHLARILLASRADDPGVALANGVVEQPRLPETPGETLPLLVLAALVVATGVAIWTPLATVLSRSVAILSQ